jgi:NACalpha-BTF3-like transcription factor
VWLSNPFLNLCNLDDKKLGGVLKKMGLTDIKGVEEVNIFKNDGSVIHISGPKSKFIFFVLYALILLYV